MIYPEDERIRIASNDHSIAVARDVSTPTYSFPNTNNMKVEKAFLTAGLRGVGCCAGCASHGVGDASAWNIGDLLLIGMAAMFIVPHFLKR